MMILIGNKSFSIEPYDSENEFEDTVWELRKSLFGPNRLFLILRKKLEIKGKYKIFQMDI